jgi:branched-chain amino acid transport system permease protein
MMALTFWTRFGRAIVRSPIARMMSRIVGIHPDRNIAWVLFIGAGLAGLAGVLISYDVGRRARDGYGAVLKGAVASIIGGLGQLYG